MWCKDSSADVRYYSWMVRATTTLTATSFKQKILAISSYYMECGVKNGLQFLIKPFITSTFFLPSSSEGKRHDGRLREERERGSVYRQIAMSRKGLNYIVGLGH